MGFLKTIKDLSNPNPYHDEKEKDPGSEKQPMPTAIKKREDGNGQPAANPSQPAANPGQPAANPSQPAANPGQPAANPGQPAVKLVEATQTDAVDDSLKAEIEAKDAEIGKMKAELKNLENQLHYTSLAESSSSDEDVKKVLADRIKKINDSILSLRADIAIAEAAVPNMEAVMKAEKIVKEIEAAEKAKEEAEKRIATKMLPCIESLNETELNALIRLLLESDAKSRSAMLVKAIQTAK